MQWETMPNLEAAEVLVAGLGTKDRLDMLGVVLCMPPVVAVEETIMVYTMLGLEEHGVPTPQAAVVPVVLAGVAQEPQAMLTPLVAETVAGVGRPMVAQAEQEEFLEAQAGAVVLKGVAHGRCRWRRCQRRSKNLDGELAMAVKSYAHVDKDGNVLNVSLWDKEAADAGERRHQWSPPEGCEAICCDGASGVERGEHTTGLQTHSTVPL